MARYLTCFVAMMLAHVTLASELKLDFSSYAENQTPKGFRSLVAGGGPLGDWKVIMDDVPQLMTAISTRSTVVNKHAVLAQLSRDATDERFPIFLYDEESFADFTVTARFKIVDGKEQMAGIVFRCLDEKNFYVIRANALDGNIRFYKVVNGERGPLIGPSLEIKKGVWHQLTIECKGNQIRCLLNGTEVMPPLKDNSFPLGKIGFWTKSDSLSYFTDAVITYAPRERFAASLVRATLQSYPNLLGVKIYAPTEASGPVKMIASDDAKEVNEPGSKAEEDIIKRGTVYTAKGKYKGSSSMEVIQPLHDRNGEIVAAVRVILHSFPGQTEQNAISRSIPVVKLMEKRIQSSKDLFE